MIEYLLSRLITFKAYLSTQFKSKNNPVPNAATQVFKNGYSKRLCQIVESASDSGCKLKVEYWSQTYYKVDNTQSRIAMKAISKIFQRLLSAAYDDITQAKK